MVQLKSGAQNVATYVHVCVWQVPHERQKPKLRADIERAMLVSQHKPQTYTMLSDESDSEPQSVATSHQVVLILNVAMC